MIDKKIPQTDSIQKLARSWDAHDLTDFDEELEEVGEPIFEPDTVVRIHLRADEAEALKKLAESKGVESADLIRQWMVENLKLRSVRPPASGPEEDLPRERKKLG